MEELDQENQLKRDAKILKWIDFVKNAIVAPVYRKIEGLVPFDDLMDVATEELVKQVDAYYKKGQHKVGPLIMSPNGSIRMRINGALMDWLRTMDPAPSKSRVDIRKLNDFYQKYANEHGAKQPSPAEVLDGTGFDEKYVNQLKAYQQMRTETLDDFSNMINMDDKYDEPGSISEAEVEIMLGQLYTKLRDVLKTFTNEDERLMFEMMYFENFEMDEVSELLEIPYTKLSEMHMKVINEYGDIFKNIFQLTNEEVKPAVKSRATRVLNMLRKSNEELDLTNGIDLKAIAPTVVRDSLIKKRSNGEPFDISKLKSGKVSISSVVLKKMSTPGDNFRELLQKKLKSMFEGSEIPKVSKIDVYMSLAFLNLVLKLKLGPKILFISIDKDYQLSFDNVNEKELYELNDDEAFKVKAMGVLNAFITNLNRK